MGQRIAIPRPPTYSTARLDSLVCPVLVDCRELESCLPLRGGLSLPRLPHVPEGRHPIVVEIWRVQDGLIHFAGLDAHRLWELAGGVAGLGVGGSAGATLGAGMGGAAGAANGGALGMWLGPLGWWWGAVTGAVAGAAAGATMAATAGALRGAGWGADAGRRTSETNSRVIGTYNEIMVTVPCRLALRSGLAGDVAYVLGTYTDSAASVLGESFVAWGYRKSQAFGRRTDDGAVEVRIGASAARFRVVTDQASGPAPSAAVRSGATHVLKSLSHPLFGMTPGGRPIVSFLDRSFGAQAVRVTPASVRLEWSAGFLPGLPAFATDINAVSSREPWGALAITGLPVELSYPRAVDY
jgi:hypothetical protein